METPAPPASVVELTISITRALRNTANAILEQAHKARAAGQLTLDEFFAVTDRYQMIINQANMACYEAVEHLPPIEKELIPIETAAKELEQASLHLAKVTDVLVISAQLLQALSALVLAILNPEPGAFVSVAFTIAGTVQNIQRQLSH
jgi:hypothetical protein